MSPEAVPVVTLTLNPAIDQMVTLDRLVPGAVHRARAVRNNAGGKGLNVASCLADWGVPVAATGILGRDNAVVFDDLLASKGIDDRFVRVPGETRTNLKLVDAADGQTTDINLPGLACGDAAVEGVRAALRDLTGTGSLVVLAGSLPGTLADDTYADLVVALRARGARVVLDASGPALAAALAAGHRALPDVIKPNRHELEEWVGRPLAEPAALRAAARALHERGIGLVVVSLGAEGALFVGEAGVLHARAPTVAIESTVGAGDALVAGLAAGLHADLPLTQTARLALAFAAGKLTRAGPNLPDRARVQALARTIAVEALD